MSLFGNQYGGGNMAMEQKALGTIPYKPRTIREQIQDKISYHKGEISNLEEALNALTPEVEKFIDAAQKVNL